MAGKTYQIQLAGRDVELEVISYTAGQLQARIDGEEIRAGCQLVSPGLVRLELLGRVAWVHLARVGSDWQVAHGGCHLTVEPQLRRRSGAGGKSLPSEVTPPMPATVVKVQAQPGDLVSRGQALVVVSAMKMEVTLKAPKDGTVREVLAQVGDQVSPGQVLVTFEEEQDDSQ